MSLIQNEANKEQFNMNTYMDYLINCFKLYFIKNKTSVTPRYNNQTDEFSLFMGNKLVIPFRYIKQKMTIEKINIRLLLVIKPKTCASIQIIMLKHINNKAV